MSETSLFWPITLAVGGLSIGLGLLLSWLRIEAFVRNYGAVGGPPVKGGRDMPRL